MNQHTNKTQVQEPAHKQSYKDWASISQH